MKNKLFSILVVLLLLVSGVAYAQNGTLTEVWVATSGNDDSNAGTQGSPFATIQKGIDAVAPGGTVYVAAGTYSETLAIEKSLTLQGEGKEKTTIDGGGNSPCIRVKVNNAVINGLTIKNNKAAGEAIRFDYGCTTCTIENCNIITSASAGYGVHIYGSNNITIQNNNISGGTYGVIADQGVSNYIKIKDNTMANLRDGVVLKSGTGHEVEGNNISTTLSNSTAIEVFASDTAVKDNILLGSGTSGVSIGSQPNIVVEGNKISGKTTAIHVGNDALNARVENNILSSNREGIHVQTGPGKEANLNISGNTISNSTVADIYVSGSQGPIDIWENDISGGPCGVKIEDSGDRKSTGVSINSNSIHGHTGYGVNNEAVETVDATCNWWGDALGPKHASNPYKDTTTGDTVSDNVNFTPWCINEAMTELSNEVDIKSYKFEAAKNSGVLSSDIEGTIDKNNHTVTLTVPYGTNVTALVATFTLSDGATAKVGETAQASGTTPNNFTEPVTYTITSLDGTIQKNWIVTVTITAASSIATLSDLTIDGTTITGFDPNIYTYTYTLPYGTTTIPTVGATPTDPNATIVITQATSLTGGEAERTATVVVTAQDGTTTETYKVIFGYIKVTMTKTGPATASQGNTITYTITYKNEGLNAAKNVVITETYPPEVEFVGSDPLPTTGNNQWKIGDLAPGDEGTITVTVRIK